MPAEPTIKTTYLRIIEGEGESLVELSLQQAASVRGTLNVLKRYIHPTRRPTLAKQSAANN